MMKESGDVSSPWVGFWQIVYDDTDDEIVPFPALYTTVSLRRSGFSIYTPTRFIEIRAAANRRPPAGWPATDDEARQWHDTCVVSCGSSSWQQGSTGWAVDHRPQAAGGGLARLPTARDAEFQGDHATVGNEQWRRLSGPGTSPLAGAWGQQVAGEAWMYLATAGHYGVARIFLDRDDDDMHRVHANAGARVESAHSFDNWPFITTHGVGSMDARKHETFRLTAVSRDSFSAGFATDGSDAAPWQRIE